MINFIFSSVQLLSHVRLFETPWTAAHQASLSITNSQSLLRLMFIQSGMPCNHFVLCHPLLLLPSILPNIRFFSKRRPFFWVLSGFPESSVGKESTCNVGDLGSISGLGISPGKWKGYAPQYSGLENSMDSPWGHKKSDTTKQLSLSFS